MIRAMTMAASLATAACMPPPPAGGPDTSALRPAIGPEIIVSFDPGRQASRYLVERVAARCWLDGVISGAQMIVNRQTGNLVIVGDTRDLLAADFLEPQGGFSRVRLSGPMIADPVKKNRLVAALVRAARTGETACPITDG